MDLDKLETLCLKVIDAHKEAGLGQCNLIHVIFDYVCQTDLEFLAIFQAEEEEIEGRGFVYDGSATHLLREKFYQTIWIPLRDRIATKYNYPDYYTTENYSPRDIDGDFDGSHFFEVCFE